MHVLLVIALNCALTGRVFVAKFTTAEVVVLLSAVSLCT